MSLFVCIFFLRIDRFSTVYLSAHITLYSEYQNRYVYQIHQIGGRLIKFDEKVVQVAREKREN